MARILWFSPTADTPGRTVEGCGFRDLMGEYEEKNALIVGVSFDSQEENRAFSEKHNFNYPLLCDTDRSMGLAYGATKAGDPRGAKRIGVVIDPDGNIKEYEPKANAGSYPRDVLARL